MSDSPANRPRRSTSFASFYIDEDDFEENPLKLDKKSKKSNDEDVFVGCEDDEESDKETAVHPINGESNPVSKPKSKPKPVPSSKNANRKPKKSSKESTSKKVESAESSISDDQLDRWSNCDPEEDEEDENEDTQESPSKSAIKSRIPKLKDAKDVKDAKPVIFRPAAVNKNKSNQLSSITSGAIEKGRNSTLSSGIRRVGLSRSAPIRPLSPVKLKKFE